MIIGTMIYIMADVGRAKMLSDSANIDATLRTVVPVSLRGLSHRGDFHLVATPYP